jgi:hypothetical protein
VSSPSVLVFLQVEQQHEGLDSTRSLLLRSAKTFKQGIASSGWTSLVLPSTDCGKNATESRQALAESVVYCSDLLTNLHMRGSQSSCQAPLRKPPRVKACGVTGRRSYGAPSHMESQVARKEMSTHIAWNRNTRDSDFICYMCALRRS